ncbi:MAG: recombinase family protein [Phycisphaerae bacterium]|nr:recombinase family protein [Phycisphaerae bacterium]
MSSYQNNQKVTSNHLKRNAYLYIRQSTLRQVFENTESTKRQYALSQRAIALGWKAENIIIIDSDLGQSGASAVDREGFQRLVAEVGVGNAGIVLGLEVSRLARNSMDWHRLLEICALSDTLILDEDGLYDPGHFNDRLLLGLKGTMSEAELHVLKARLQGGLRNKASRGELKISLPVGLCYDSQDKVILNPDKQVQNALHVFFSTYEQKGSACAIVRYFRQQGLLFPRRLCKGVDKGRLVWGKLCHSRALQVLHNPRYAGAFVFGRTKTYKRSNGGDGYKPLPQEQWHTLIPDAHPGYITWQQYQSNLKQLRQQSQRHGHDRRKSPPCQGPALLQGIAMCGICGSRMTVRYHHRRGQLEPDYVCQSKEIQYGKSICQSISGQSIDDTISKLLIDELNPVNLEIMLSVQQQLRQRIEQVDELKKQQVERIAYETKLAKMRYMKVDPNNRLVADQLEADWNVRLRELTEAQEDYQKQRQKSLEIFDKQMEDKVLSLADNFSQVWNNSATPMRERKRMIQLLIEDVTLVKNHVIKAQIRFRGGAEKVFTIPIPLNSGQERKTDADIVKRIDQLLDNMTEQQIASQLNIEGYKTGMGKTFSSRIVAKIRKAYNLKSRFTRLRESGMLTSAEMANELSVHSGTVKTWTKHGFLRACKYNSKDSLYELIAGEKPVKMQGTKLLERKLLNKFTAERANEVQYEA